MLHYLRRTPPRCKLPQPQELLREVQFVKKMHQADVLLLEKLGQELVFEVTPCLPSMIHRVMHGLLLCFWWQAKQQICFGDEYDGLWIILRGKLRMMLGVGSADVVHNDDVDGSKALVSTRSTNCAVDRNADWVGH